MSWTNITIMIVLLLGLSFLFARWLSSRAKKRVLETPSDVNEPPEDAEFFGGIWSRVVVPAPQDARKPAPHDRVLVHYTGWCASDGQMFDSSIHRGVPTSINLNHVIDGWKVGLAQMGIGERRRMWIPPELAYGESPTSGEPSGMLVFDVELLDVEPGADQ